jgi:small subunit ribosomal protein S18
MTTRSGGGRFGGRRGRPRYYARRKVCSFCVDHVKHIDYKEVEKFRRFLTDRYKIEARRKTGTCSKHQRGLSTAIKRARHLAMIPFSPDHWMSARAPAR